MTFDLPPFTNMPLPTFLHVVVSLVGIGSGLVAVGMVLAGRRAAVWAAVFLGTTVATSVSGFFLPADRFLPSHAVGMLSLVILSVTILARYGRPPSRLWERVYAAGAVAALYLNVFVLVAQLFQKLPALAASAPTQSEPPFVVTQLAVLAAFGAVGVAAVRAAGLHRPRTA